MWITVFVIAMGCTLFAGSMAADVTTQTFAIVDETDVCPDGFDLVGDSCLALADSPMSRDDAQLECRSLSSFANLASFQRRGKKNMIRKWVADNVPNDTIAHWTSGFLNTDNSSIAKYIWEPTDERVGDFTQLWQQGRSPATAVEPCLEMTLEPPFRNRDYRLIDKQCNLPSHALCEIELCNRCKLINGIYFSDKTDRCDCYVQCFDGNQFQPLLRSCEPGEFWDHASLVCRAADEVDCPHDPCILYPDLQSYPVKNSATLFWECTQVAPAPARAFTADVDDCCIPTNCARGPADRPNCVFLSSEEGCGAAPRTRRGNRPDDVGRQRRRRNSHRGPDPPPIQRDTCNALNSTDPSFDICAANNRFNASCRADLDPAPNQQISVCCPGQKCIAPSEIYDCPSYFCVVIDTSDSVTRGRFVRIVNTLHAWIDITHVEPGVVSWAYVVFSTEIDGFIDFMPFQTAEELKQLISTNLTRGGGRTFTNLGIEYCVDSLLNITDRTQSSSQGTEGNNGSDEKIPGIIIIITDGNSVDTNKTGNQIRRSADAGFHVFVILLGDEDLTDFIDDKNEYNKIVNCTSIRSYGMLEVDAVAIFDDITNCTGTSSCVVPTGAPASTPSMISTSTTQSTTTSPAARSSTTSTQMTSTPTATTKPTTTSTTQSTTTPTTTTATTTTSTTPSTTLTTTLITPTPTPATSASTATTTMTTPATPSTNDCPAYFCVVIDGSVNTGKFRQIINTLEIWIDITSDVVSWGYVVFSGDRAIFIDFRPSSDARESLISLNLLWREPGDSQAERFTNLGIEYCVDLLTNTIDEEMPGFIIIITETKSTDPSKTETQIQRAMDSGIHVFAIVVGNRNDFRDFFEYSNLNCTYNFPSFAVLKNNAISVFDDMLTCSGAFCVDPTTSPSTTTTSTTTTSTTPSTTTTLTTPTTSPTTSTSTPTTTLTTSTTQSTTTTTTTSPTTTSAPTTTTSPSTTTTRITTPTTPSTPPTTTTTPTTLSTPSTTTTPPPVVHPVCGDGIVQAGEACDHGDENNNLICTGNCKFIANCRQPITTQPPCRSSAVPDSPSEYLEETPSGPTRRPCAPGTIFTPQTCNCGGFISLPVLSDAANNIDERYVAFQSKDIPTHFIGLAEPFTGTGDRITITSQYPLRFNIIAPGLSGAIDTISLECAEYRDYYSVYHTSGDVFLEKLVTPDDADQRHRASFIRHRDQACAGCSSFEVASEPGVFIAHQGRDTLVAEEHISAEPVGSLVNAGFADATGDFCFPDLWIDFSDSTADISPLELYVENRPFGNPVSVNTVLGFGTFSSSNENRLVIPHYAAFDFGKELAISFSFDDLGQPNENKPLLANSDCAEGPSLEISLQIQNIVGSVTLSVVRATIVNIDDETFSVEVPYTPNMRNDFLFAYDGVKISLARTSPNGTTCEVQQATGYVRVCHCTVQIGHSWRERFITANIYNIQLYNCIPPAYLAVCS